MDGSSTPNRSSGAGFRKFPRSEGGLAIHQHRDVVGFTSWDASNFRRLSHNCPTPGFSWDVLEAS